MGLGADYPDAGPCFTGDTYGLHPSIHPSRPGLPYQQSLILCRVCSRPPTTCAVLLLHTRHGGETQHLCRARVEIPPGLNSIGSRVAPLSDVPAARSKGSYM